MDNEILIIDSCILFDLMDIDIIEEFFQLGFVMYTTPSVIAEIKDELQLSIINKYIYKKALSVDHNGLLESIQKFYDEIPGLSYTDCSVLESAVRNKGIIMTSDKSLRNESKRRNFNVRGLIWVIETLFYNNIISKNIALNKLNIYPEINQRVPKEEISKLIHKIENQL